MTYHGSRAPWARYTTAPQGQGTMAQQEDLQGHITQLQSEVALIQERLWQVIGWAGRSGHLEPMLQQVDGALSRAVVCLGTCDAFLEKQKNKKAHLSTGPKQN